MSRSSESRLAASRRIATAVAASAPLSSIVPRPYRYPSRSTGWNGGEVHFAASAPTTSMWPMTSTARLVGLAARSRATKLARPSPGSRMRVSIPGTPRRNPSRCFATRISLPGGILCVECDELLQKRKRLALRRYARSKLSCCCAATELTQRTTMKTTALKVKGQKAKVRCLSVRSRCQVKGVRNNVSGQDRAGAASASSLHLDLARLRGTSTLHLCPRLCLLPFAF